MPFVLNRVSYSGVCSLLNRVSYSGKPVSYITIKYSDFVGYGMLYNWGI